MNYWRNAWWIRPNCCSASGPQKQIGKHAQGECFVLRCLARSAKPLLPSDLSNLAQSSTARIAVVLNTLEKKGYITRAIDPSDRRRVLVSLTPAGAEYIQGVRRQLRQRMRVLLEELGEADAKEYLRITERILSITQRMAQKR